MARNVHTSPTAARSADARQYVLPWQQPAQMSPPPETASADPGADSAKSTDALAIASAREVAPARGERVPGSSGNAQPQRAKAAKLCLHDRVERLLRDRSIPYVNVDEAKRTLFASAKLRAFHFVAYAKDGPNWLIFAAKADRRARENMAEWERVFGEGFIAVLASPSSGDATGVRFRTLSRQTLALDPPKLQAAQSTGGGRLDGGVQC